MNRGTASDVCTAQLSHGSPAMANPLARRTRARFARPLRVGRRRSFRRRRRAAAAAVVVVARRVGSSPCVAAADRRPSGRWRSTSESCRGCRRPRVLGPKRHRADGEQVARLDRHGLLGDARLADEGAVERAQVADHQHAVGLEHFAVLAADQRMAASVRSVLRLRPMIGGQLQIELARLCVAADDNQFRFHVPLPHQSIPPARHGAKLPSEHSAHHSL